MLLNVALNGTTHHVETLVRQFRRVQEVEELSREARQYSQRRLTYFHDSDGSLVVKLQLTAESGALFLKAIEAVLSVQLLPEDVYYITGLPTDMQTGDIVAITLIALLMIPGVILAIWAMRHEFPQTESTAAGITFKEMLAEPFKHPGFWIFPAIMALVIAVIFFAAFWDKTRVTEEGE